MTTSEQWLALAERCEMAKGADRDIDLAILEALNPGCEWRPYSPRARIKWLYASDGRIIACGTDAVKPYTASLDAITALIKLELPVWQTDIHTADASIEPYPIRVAVEYDVEYAECEIAYLHPSLEPRIIAEAGSTSPALALWAAFCRAMAEKAPPAGRS